MVMSEEEIERQAILEALKQACRAVREFPYEVSKQDIIEGIETALAPTDIDWRKL